MMSLTCVSVPFIVMVRGDSACFMKANNLLNEF